MPCWFGLAGLSSRPNNVGRDSLYLCWTSLHGTYYLNLNFLQRRVHEIDISLLLCQMFNDSFSCHLFFSFKAWLSSNISTNYYVGVLHYYWTASQFDVYKIFVINFEDMEDDICINTSYRLIYRHPSRL